VGALEVAQWRKRTMRSSNSHQWSSVVISGHQWSSVVISSRRRTIRSSSPYEERPPRYGLSSERSAKN